MKFVFEKWNKKEVNIFPKFPILEIAFCLLCDTEECEESCLYNFFSPFLR
jgi:hypothetical protein